MYTIYEVARNFYDRDRSMSLKKLQKLCWYAYSWYVALNNEPCEDDFHRLFNERAQAWVHGPVFPVLYEDFKCNNSIKMNSANIISNSEVLSFLDEVYKVYGDFSGDELESITLQEEPWIRARRELPAYEPCTNFINDKDIFKEYLDRK